MAEVVDRRQTASGEMVLRRTDGGYEIIVDGVFAMASHHDGRSERHQVGVTLQAVHRPRTALIGGLGLGFGLNRAVDDQRLEQIVVVEVEPAVLDWHGSYLAELAAAALADPRVSIVQGDVADVVEEAVSPFDAVMLDVDNGPDWLIRPGNARLYGEPFIASCTGALTAGGALSVWASQRSADLVARLHHWFDRVEEHVVEVPRGEPDWICVASRPRR